MKSKLIFSLIFMPILAFVMVFATGCSSGSNGNINLRLLITNFADIAQKTKVEVIEGTKVLASGDVKSDGSISLKFNSSTKVVNVSFIGEDILLIRTGVGVTDNSTIELELRLQLEPALVLIDSWIVLQKTIRVTNENVVSLNELLAEVFIDGEGNNDCIVTENNTVVDFEVNSISITNCREGVRSEDNSSVVLLADEEITIISDQSAVRTNDSATVNIGQATDASNNTVFVQSVSKFGADAAENSDIVFSPQNDCTIQGGTTAIIEKGNGMIDTADCTLIGL